MKYQNQNGFTIIEILVVLAIIAVVTTVGFTSFLGTQRTSRNARRITDLEKIRTGLEEYKGDNGSYPATSPGSTETYLKTPLVSPTAYFSSTTFPKDPQTGLNYFYYYERNPSSGGNNTYRLCTYLEAPFPSGLPCPAGAATANCKTTGGSVACNYGLSEP